MFTVNDPITWNPRRILVAGASGAGKTTLCGEIERRLSLPRVEIDSLYHGPDWTPRPPFVAEVEAFCAGHEWVIEWQYRAVRRLLVERADTLVWLDYPSWLQMKRLIGRTLRRRLARQELWNGNFEPPLRSIFSDEDHIIRWGMRTRSKLRPVVPILEREHPGLHVVRLRSPRQTRRWLHALTV